MSSGRDSNGAGSAPATTARTERERKSSVGGAGADRDARGFGVRAGAEGGGAGGPLGAPGVRPRGLGQGVGGRRGEAGVAGELRCAAAPAPTPTSSDPLSAGLSAALAEFLR